MTGAERPPAAELNVEKALVLLHGNRALLRQLLTMFVDLEAQDESKLRQALDEGRREDAVRVVHSLRGVATLLGADDLAAISVRTERALRDPRQADDVPALVTEFGCTLQAALDSAARHLRTDTG